MQKIIVIIGPTASGKSDLAVEIAEKFNGEIISADSRQVYKGLDIGTGKITKNEMRGVPHHLLDVVSPKRRFTAHDFIEKGTKAIREITKRGKVPIVAGGTGFYIDSLIGSVSLPHVPPNEIFREWLETKSEKELFAMLKTKDSKRAKTIQKDNRRRLVRALEIIEELGSVPKVTKVGPLYDVLWIGIAPDKKKLRGRIHKRLLARIKKGMVAEAKRLHEKGLSYKRMEELGLEYRYLAKFLKKEISKDEMIEQLSAKIWQYARRQMTYWRRNEKIRWIKANKNSEINKLVSDFLGV